ncbi:MAG: putative Ceramide glucosyltransferase [Pedosphaera sp.]|nr:putative Ceramide glucosyltransferase [Pedosphaera sp.]
MAICPKRPISLKWRLPNCLAPSNKRAVVFALAFLALLSLLLTLWQWVVTWPFPLHQRVKDRDYVPPVTLLKPLKGWDEKTHDCLGSWLKQDYGGAVQVLMGVSSPHDPAVEGVSQLIKAYPGCNAQLVLCEESLGVNAKVSTLIQLLRQARNEIIVVSDADVFVAPDYLLNAVAPLRDPEIGLVNSFYRLANPATVAMRCEAIAINADFWSQVLQGRSMQPLDFALGAVMVTRREQLAKIGGFEALADYLADDFQLGNRIVRTGKSIALCPVVVDCFSPPMGWPEVWSHQLRWSRTIRACKPLPYAFSILSNATFWPLLWLLARPVPGVLAMFGICVLVRMVMALALQKRLAPMGRSGLYAWLVPVKDLLQFALWLLAFFGNHIEWRGQQYRLLRDGKLVRS